MKKERKIKYKIQKSDGSFKFNGTGHASWFTLEKARELVNYEAGERIVEHDGVNVLWETF